MRLMGMRFKDFTWKDNPVSLRVAHARRVGEVNVPYGESKAEELGPQRRSVTGEGYFAGEDCMEAWAGLQRAFSQKGPGLLQLPGVEPFWALMDSLELVGAQGKDLVRYTFSFTEWAFIRIKRISTGSHNCNIQVPGTGSQSLVIAILYAFSPFGLPENTALQPVFPRFPISTVNSIFGLSSY